MPIPKKIEELIQTFEFNFNTYKSAEYNEAQLRIEFINPLFEHLGWDVSNKSAYAPGYRDVVNEDTLRIGSMTKSPDYSFRIGGNRKFFLEAKKPAVNIKNDSTAAYQLRRYAWSAKLSLSILTDFEEFAVYDTRIKPSQNDSASVARIMYFTYKDYADKWDELSSIFSKEAVLKGSFDKFAQANKDKKGTTEVDDAFLMEMEDWRVFLAKNIALRNPELSQRLLNEAVQRTIDRIVFLRIAEDRGIETYGQMQSLLNGSNVYPRLKQYFLSADNKFNSGLFHFHSEKSRAEYDNFTLDLNIDDKVLKDIIKKLYYPDSPYEFSIIPTDILGQVYERFLGKVIRLTPSGMAKVEEKPEVRKSGGVFYTPTYIVDYIIRFTVGKLLGSGSGERGSGDAKKLKILDPACGSGSFLLGAYEFLLKWYLNYYSLEPEKWLKKKLPPIYQTTGGYKLTLNEKKSILLNNIFGVDIDVQAVEVTKLSLLLKTLEDETGESINSQLTMLDRVLPDLDNNIKCGNSLISTNYYNGNDLLLFDSEEMYKINVFDWESEFADIISAGGFDIIIGNPPYVRNRELDDKQKKYFEANYKSATGQYDIYQLFYEKGINLLSDEGVLGFISSNKFTVANYGMALRKLILSKCLIDHIIDVSNIRIFKDASTYPYIMILDKGNDDEHIIKFKRINTPEELEELTEYELIAQAEFNHSGEKTFTIKNIPDFITRIENENKKLGELCTIKETIHTGNIRHKLILDEPIDENSKKLLFGRDCHRYYIEWSGKYINYNRNLINKRKKEYANLCQTHYFEEPKILMRDIANKIDCYLDYEQYYSVNTLYSVQLKDAIFRYEYLLGVLNSKLLTYFFRLKFEEAHVRGGYLRFKKTYSSQIPIYCVNLNNKAEKKKHDRISELVVLILDLNRKLQGTSLSTQERKLIQKQVALCDNQIDALVYQLYGLSKEEIQQIELANI